MLTTFQLTAFALEYATDNPEQPFVLIDDCPVVEGDLPSNLYCAQFAEYEGAYLAGVEAAYRRFVDTMAGNGLLIACDDDPGARDLATYAHSTGRRVLTYGLAKEADVRLLAPTPTEEGGRAGLVVGAEHFDLVLQVPGRHNLENAAGAYAALTSGCGLDPRTALDGLARFTGAARRFDEALL